LRSAAAHSTLWRCRNVELEDGASSGHNRYAMPPSRILVALPVALTTLAAFGAEPAKSPVAITNHPLEFIDTSFENASPVWYEFAPDSPVLVHLLYDVEPYRLSDLDKFLAGIRTNRLVQVTAIGRTVQGRELEMLRVGNPQAPFRVFLRARAHAWEPGGNWVLEGLVHRLLKDDPEARK